MFDFTIHHIRFTVEATTPIAMGEFKGSALRGAWTGYMRRAYCGAPPSRRSDPMHEAICPVCYLTSRDTGAESRRPFALQPPTSRQPSYAPGERFSFGFSLFGNAQVLLPYVLLAVREVGESHGLGGRMTANGARGRYRLVTVTAVNPHTDAEETLFQAPDVMVTQPTVAVTAADIARRSATLGQQSRHQETSSDNGHLHLHLHTPLRIIDNNKLMRAFAFTPFLQRLIERLYGLQAHFGRASIGDEQAALRTEVNRLLPLAQQVRIVADESEWWDVKGYSSRLNKPHYLGGLVGRITLTAPDWTPLLPYLLWGQSAQLGKNVVKGGGVYQLTIDD